MTALDLDQRVIATIRTLAMDAVQAAPVDVLAASLFARFRSRQDHTLIAADLRVFAGALATDLALLSPR